MKKIISSLFLFGSLMLVSCNDGNETTNIRKEWNIDEVTFINTNLNFTNASNYVPCYVIDEQVEFETLSGPVGFAFKTKSATNDNLVEYKSLLVKNNYEFNSETSLYTLNVSTENYFAINPTLTDDTLTVFVYNNVNLTSTDEVRKTWTTSEVTFINTNLNFINASSYVPCYVIDEQVEFETLSGPVGFAFKTKNATNDNLVEYKSLLVKNNYQFNSETSLYTLNVSAENYFAINPTLTDDTLTVFVYNNVNLTSTDEVRKTWTTSEVEMFDTYFFNGASELVPCFVPSDGELTDSYFSEYECLSVEAITEDETLVDTYLDIIIDFGYVEEYDSDYEMYTYYYDIDENSFMNVDCY